jgi:hypothetical protein
MFVATNTQKTQRMILWMQQSYELWQQRLSCRQRSFLVATGMPIRNQITIHGKKDTSIATLHRYYHNAQLVVAIGTHEGNHLFHRSINTNLLQ